jgi:hypothetical protein
VLAAVFDDELPAEAGGLRRLGSDGASVEDAVDLYRNSILLAGTGQSGIWRKALGSTDWRQVWPASAGASTRTAAAGAESVFSIYHDRDTPGLMLATTGSGTLLRSTDWGASWKTFTGADLSSSIMVFPGPEGMALLTTRTNGLGKLDVKTGRFLKSSGVDDKDPITDIAAVSSARKFAVSVMGRVYRSDDAGSSFVTAGVIPPLALTYHLAL